MIFVSLCDSGEFFYRLGQAYYQMLTFLNLCHFSGAHQNSSVWLARLRATHHEDSKRWQKEHHTFSWLCSTGWKCSSEVRVAQCARPVPRRSEGFSCPGRRYWDFSVVRENSRDTRESQGLFLGLLIVTQEPFLELRNSPNIVFFLRTTKDFENFFSFLNKKELKKE